MKERPILFSAPMVRALLAGTKTQTRRVAKVENTMGHASISGPRKGKYSRVYLLDKEHDLREVTNVCRYGQPGDRLWVREAFCPIYPQDPTYNGGNPIEYDYAATYTHGYRLGDSLGIKKKWKPSIHMPRAASRITLEIFSVRIERLHEISDADALAEGITPLVNGRYPCKFDDGKMECMSPVTAYASLWISLNGGDSWAANPWVWVVEFKVVKP